MTSVRSHGAAALRSGRARARVFPGWRVLGTQVALMVLAALCYFGVRGHTRSREGPAQEHARDLLSVERDLRIDGERWLQDGLIGHDVLVDAANAVYMYGHWPVIAVTLAVLFTRAPDRYWLLRNAMFASGAIGLVIFALYPVAPPRLGVLDIVDTVTERTDVYRTLQPPGLTNRYAAMPSLHFGWNLILGVVLWQTTRSRVVRVFAVAMPAAMAVAVVATGNHFVLDVAGGAAVALTGLLVARMLPTVIPVPRWARPPSRL